MTGRITVPGNLPELVRAAFAKAKANGDINFYPTQATIVPVNKISFQLRFSPALASKPTAQKQQPPSSEKSKEDTASPPKRFNPFLDPDPALLIAKLPAPADHNLVLNKFAIVPEHFILATRLFVPQTDLLEPLDLAAALACIDAYHRYDETAGGEERKMRRNKLFVFYNSGENSGASQPHRHMQLLPVDRMRDGLPPGGGDSWEVLADVLISQTAAQDVPFPCFAARLDADAYDDSGLALHQVYMDLYNRMVDGVDAGGEAGISYNLAMTLDAMVLCPRKAEGGPLYGKGREEVGSLSLNGTVLAGTALVRTEAEWDALREDPEQLSAILSKI